MQGSQSEPEVESASTADREPFPLDLEEWPTDQSADSSSGGSKTLSRAYMHPGSAPCSDVVAEFGVGVLMCMHHILACLQWKESETLLRGRHLQQTS